MLAFRAYIKLEKELRKVAGDNILIVVYGTPKSFYDRSTDLDVCVYKHYLTNAEKKLIAETVEKFHMDNNLKIDTDISFINKTAFDERDFEALESEPPFEKINNKLIFNPVNFTRAFLDSKQMNLRLFLNVFTTKTKLIYGSRDLYNYNIIRMYHILISYILTTNPHIALPEAIDLVFSGGANQNYKTYLGYNKRNKRQRKYITKKLTRLWFNGMRYDDKEKI